MKVKTIARQRSITYNRGYMGSFSCPWFDVNGKREDLSEENKIYNMVVGRSGDVVSGVSGGSDLLSRNRKEVTERGPD